MVHLIQILDESFTPKSDQRETEIRKALQDRKLETPLPYAPANQFTNRGIGDLVRMIKGSFLIEQLFEGVPFDQIRYTIELEDLHLLRFGSITMSPSDFVKNEKKPANIFPSFDHGQFRIFFWRYHRNTCCSHHV
jgi:hypothetical protein